MVTRLRVNYHFAMYTNVKSLYCTSETNGMLHVNYSWTKKKRKKCSRLENKRNIYIYIFAVIITVYLEKS